MGKFIAYVKQDVGCDYTIACGETVWKLKSTTYDTAIEELRTRIIGTRLTMGEVPWQEELCGHWGEMMIDSAVLYEISSEHGIPVAEWYSEAEKRKKEIAQAEKSEKERAEYERLKKKFG